jgi:two-component system NtrC family response regulator
VLERALILSRSDLLDTDVLPPQILRPDPHTPKKRGPAIPAGHFPAVSSPTGNLDPFPAGGSPNVSPNIPSGASLSHNSLEEAERNALLQALQEHEGHREKTADALGISRRTLQYKLKKFGLSRRG